MNQSKIGKFIAECRKEKNLTQEHINEFFYGERISKDEIESISEENLCRMFRDRYGKVLRRKYAILSGVVGTLFSILIYILVSIIYL